MVSFSGGSHVTIDFYRRVLFVVILYLSLPPSHMGNGLPGGVSSFNPGLLCGSRRDKVRAGLDCITGGWLVLLGGRGGCSDVPLSVVCNAGALLTSFSYSSGGPLVGLRIGCGVTEASSFLRNLRFRKVIDSDPVLVVRVSFDDLACCIPPTIVRALHRHYVFL